MRVIITGGTGLIGSALVKNLANDGHHVHILSRNPRQTEALPATVHFHKWDGKTADGWGQLADGADAIINLAGESVSGEGFFPSKWSWKRKKLILQSRVEAGEAVMQAIKGATNKPKVLIQSSAVGYYGTQTGDQDVTEDFPAGNDYLADVCKQWEASTAEAEKLGVRRPVVRTGVVLSADGGALPRMALPFKMKAGGILGNGKQVLPWIHLDDEVSAIRFLINNENANGVFNLSAPNPVTNKEMSKELGKVLGNIIPA
ncbi:MAG TPA: TIGR01777 family oxidoreductase, partial [Aggregatilineales bacterium]|nr:TIGR01777 family oxidoreductase [Aggregatilineales bacterium]